MKYQINFPEEPEGPLWDQDGRKYVRTGPKNTSAPNECGLWELAAPKSEKPYYTWAELLSTRDIFDDGILGEDDQDNFHEVTPVLAVPADDLIKLLLAEGAEMIHHLQNKICNWLDSHSQIHWEERTK